MARMYLHRRDEEFTDYGRKVGRDMLFNEIINQILPKYSQLNEYDKYFVLGLIRKKI